MKSWCFTTRNNAYYGVLILNTVEDPENYLTYFMKIDNKI